MVVNKNTTLPKKKSGDIIFLTYRNQRITCVEKSK